jgi:predicted aldo/keto reductase-like oxidoreductase
MELLRHYARLNGTSYCRHACNDCSGACPYGVPIADVLRTRMYATDYEDAAFARREYADLAVNASACLGCSGGTVPRRLQPWAAHRGTVRSHPSDAELT